MRAININNPDANERGTALNCYYATLACSSVFNRGFAEPKDSACGIQGIDVEKRFLRFFYFKIKNEFFY